MNLFKQMQMDGYENVVFGVDKKTGLKSIIVIHNTKLGPALGGVRMRDYKNEDEALLDCLRLARGMTYKSAAAGINVGGGKAVIIGDPYKDKTPALLRAFGRFVNLLGGKYITAEDMGTSVKDMMIIRQESKFVTGLPEKFGSSGNPSPYTAFGVFCGIKACLKNVYKSENLKNRTIAMQGLGSVGYPLAQALHRDGAKLIVYDIRKDICQKAQKEFGAQIAKSDQELFQTPCDIFSPNAIGAILNSQTIPRLKCKIIAGAANNQLEDEAKHSKMIASRGILYATDFVLNAGGVINVAMEVEGKYSRQKAIKKVAKIYDNVLKMIEIAKKKKITTYQAAMLMAEERLKNVKKQ